MSARNEAILHELEQGLNHVGTPSPAGAYTSKELATLTGRSTAWVHDALREAIDAGKWECVRVPHRNIAGIMHARAAYRPVKEKVTPRQRKTKKVTPRQRRRK
jgi:hypothetical protein